LRLTNHTTTPSLWRNQKKKQILATLTTVSTMGMLSAPAQARDIYTSLNQACTL
jgi:hypothetical protein